MTLVAVGCAIGAVVLALGTSPARARMRRVVGDRPATGGAAEARRAVDLTSMERMWRPGAGHGGALGSRRARLVAALLVALAAAVVTGGPVGVVLGVGAGVVSWVGTGRLALSRAPGRPAVRTPERERAVAVLPVAAHLLGAALDAGCPPVPAAEAVGQAVGGDVGRLLVAAARRAQVGAEPAVAWRALVDDPVLRPIGRALLVATANGASAAPVLQRGARDAHDTRRWSAQERASALGAKVAAPLGLCFLPAFVLIGIVPIVATSGLALP